MKLAKLVEASRDSRNRLCEKTYFWQNDSTFEVVDYTENIKKSHFLPP